MICKNCHCIFPATYKLCPDCKSTDFEREKFKVIDKEVDKEEVIKHEAIVVCADVDFDEFE